MYKPWEIAYIIIIAGYIDHTYSVAITFLQLIIIVKYFLLISKLYYKIIIDNNYDLITIYNVKISVFINTNLVFATKCVIYLLYS